MSAKLMAIIEMVDQGRQCEEMLVINDTPEAINAFEAYASEQMGWFGYHLYFYRLPIDFDFAFPYAMYGSDEIYQWMIDNEHLEVEV